MRTRWSRLALLFVALGARGHEPITTKITWSKEISRLVYKRCIGCHGQSSAIPLTTYDQARPWATAIKEEVLSRRMPPWGAVKGFGEFRDDPSLSQPEIDLIVSWAEGGAPPGEDIYLAVPGAPRAKPQAPVRSQVLIAGANAPLIVPKPVGATALQPRDLKPGGSMQVIAYRPDGGVEPLIWIRNYPARWVDRYTFREPVLLPKGTRIVVRAEPPAAAAISIQKPER